MAATLSDKETQVFYYQIDRESELYRENIGRFKKAVQNYYNGVMSKGGARDIEEVVITKPRTNPGNGYIWHFGNGESEPPVEGGGTCQVFLDCDAGPDSGGGNGGNGEQNNHEIISHLKDYPCAQDLLMKLPNLNNALAAILNNVFKQNGNKVNIIFKGVKPDGNDALTKWKNENGFFNAEVGLNSDLLTDATQEYILITMYHEVIHAFLGYEFATLGESAFYEKYPGVINSYGPALPPLRHYQFQFLEGHNEFHSYLNDLRDILRDFNPALSDDVIDALAKGGITTLTEEEKRINYNERHPSKGQYSGTKCP